MSVSLQDYTKVSRLEYLPAEGPAIFVPTLLAVTSISNLNLLMFTESVLVFGLLYFSGFIINAATDMEVDSMAKTFVSDSAVRIGKRGLQILTLFQVSLAFILSLHISMVLGSWVPSILVAIGIFFGIGYSIEPFHFKVKGIGHVISLMLSAFTLPFMFLLYCVTQGFTVPHMLAIIGFSITHYGIALTNQSQDYLEDRAAGLTTPAVKWGLARTLKGSLTMTIIGIPIMMSGLMLISMERGYYLYGENISWIPYVMLIGAMIGYSVPLIGLSRLINISEMSQPIKDRMTGIKNVLNYPRWQASGIFGIVSASMVLFAMANFIDVTEDGTPELDTTNPILTMIDEPDYIDSRAYMDITVDMGSNPEEGTYQLELESYYAGEILGTNSTSLSIESGPGTYTLSVPYKNREETAYNVRLFEHSTSTQLEWETIPSSKESYIYNATSLLFHQRRGLYMDKMVNITIYLFNDRGVKNPDDISLKIDVLSSNGAVFDSKILDLNMTLRGGESWTPVITMDVMDVNEPHYRITLRDVRNNIIDMYNM